ncbi:MAG: metallophosphoesterase [Clostridia bacterium]|nr:metallophosphoesterase [Clostridia bacterium]
MIVLKKESGKDFIILNLTDPQLGNEGWGHAHPNQMVLREILRILIDRVHPDLITVSGDFALPGHTDAYRHFADLMDSFRIPWAPVWGNHDNEMGSSYIDSIADEYLTHQYCLYEKGPSTLGNGNYVIGIEEDGIIVEGLIMMDSHNKELYESQNGKVSSVNAKLLPAQLIWYREQVEILRKRGCNDTTLILHIPIYAYRTAFQMAFSPAFIPTQVSIEDSYKEDCWNEGYKDSFGVCYEGVSSYPVDDGVFDLIKHLNSTKTVVAGHDHVNNFVIQHKGIRLVYGTKTGIGSYWNRTLNGGTVLKITSDGVADVHHEYTKFKFDYELI